MPDVTLTTLSRLARTLGTRRHGRSRGLLRLSVPVLVLMTASGGDDWPPETLHASVEACAQGGGTYAFCTCCIEKMRARMSLKDWFTFDNQLRLKQNPDPQFVRIMSEAQADCLHYQSVGTRIDAEARRMVKSNAHTLQTMLESYGVDFGGKYPAFLYVLLREAQTGAYWHSLRNPVDASKPALSDASHPIPGAVGYRLTARDATEYEIVGWDENGLPLTDTNGQRFVLNN